MSRLAGKVALVTGGASGLGSAICAAFAAEGAFVAVADVNETDGRPVVKSLGSTARFIHLDVTDSENWNAGVAETVAAFGGLDILVNNAGITIIGSIEALSLEDWNKTLHVDLTGPFLGCKAVIPVMKANNGGSIINISSTAGLRASEHLAGYNAAKAGVTLMTQSVALHCAKQRYNIRANSIHPGIIRTPMLEKVLAQSPDAPAMMDVWISQHPVGHIGEPSDVANMAIYLASDESKFVTGAACVVDGGSSI